MLQSTMKHKDTVFQSSSTGGSVGTIPKMKTIVGENDEILEGRKTLSSDRPYEDTLDLTNELKNAAEQCQLLAGKLCVRKESTKKKSEPTTECSSHETNKKANEENKDDLRRKMHALIDENLQLRQEMKRELLSETCKEIENEMDSDIKVKLKAAIEENIRLRHILKDVTAVNKRWQKYNRDRQDYVQRLLTTIHDLEEKSQDCTSKMNVSSETVVDKNIVNRYSDSELLNPLGKFSILCKTHEHCIKENVRLQAESQEMKSNMEDLLHQFECMKNQSTEQEEMLQLQANMFKEDFLAERKEKLEVSAKLNELEGQHALLIAKCNAYEKRLQQPKQTVCALKNETFQKKGIHGISSTYPRVHKHLYSSKSDSNCNHTNFIGNIVTTGIMTDGTNETKSNDGQFQHTDSLLSVSDSVVICPRCSMHFPLNRHNEYLDHYRLCKGNMSC